MRPDQLEYFLGPERAQALLYVFEDWELAKKGDERSFSRLAQLQGIIGDDAFNLIREAKNQRDLTRTGQAMGWQLNTVKPALGLVADFLIRIQQDRDLTIY